jgi:tRNA (cmo5U34)-methyltransferase
MNFNSADLFLLYYNERNIIPCSGSVTVPQNKDQLFAHKRYKISRFAFDESVAAVFDDMIRRSVPGYQSVLQMIGHFSDVYGHPATRLYDLGASLGAATHIMSEAVTGRDCLIVAVDNSAPMVSRLKETLVDSTTDVEVACEDLLETPITNASVVVLNLAMQFIDPAARENLVSRIYQGLRPGGVLLLTEKVSFEDPDMDAHMTELYYAYKKSQGYSDLEIAQKRTALENVLICDTKQTHIDRLESCGFKNIDVWFQVLNFISLAAVK